MADFSRVHLSVLDTVPVWRGSSAADSLRNALDLARHAERLGYLRYWVAEHHNTPSLATSAPAVLAGQIAAVTSTIRVGSGAVLLPNHAPLVVAEQFGVLESLYPGRVDIGIGRASGADASAAERLRGYGAAAGDDFSSRLAELEGYFGPGREKAAVRAVPTPEGRPPFWLVGSSPQSAAFAGARGLPYVYAHQIRPGAGAASLEAYRAAFRPSVQLDRPYAAIAATVVAAEDDERAEYLGRAFVLGQIVMRTSDWFTLLPTAEEAARHRYGPAEETFVRERLDPQLVGGPDTVRRRLAALVEETGADEVMALSMISGHSERVRSYELLKGALEDLRSGGTGGSEGAHATVHSIELN
ncbi:LLM class flavin-dependent oxidoreductase [Streptomyces abyssomicinicus]|uniref:LLM class flavin-dependent oxidoreductase n=1 Tax=Streptomyces abyssomicinicus TaxID=574929 RepID=UPI0012509C76|nr:LLM class flavin-dependent oxidoreductase [Streptomyces abyssomicinicus]